MEPAKAQIVFCAQVTRIEEKIINRWVCGSGDKALFKPESLGWFVSLSGSHEAILVGHQKPSIDIGDVATVRIDFHALTGQSPIE